MKSKELFRKNVPGTTGILQKASIGIADGNPGFFNILSMD